MPRLNIVRDKINKYLKNMGLGLPTVAGVWIIGLFKRKEQPMTQEQYIHDTLEQAAVEVSLCVTDTDKSLDEAIALTAQGLSEDIVQIIEDRREEFEDYCRAFMP